MPRKVILIPLAVVAVVCVVILAAAVWRQVDSGPAIQTKALGIWQEQTTAQPIRLTVSADGGQGDVTGYWVTSGGSAAPQTARLEGDRILVQGENAQDVLWVITYDEGADALLLARPSGAERHILRRVSR